MVTAALLLFMLSPVYGLLVLAQLRTRQMNQYILNDALMMLRRGALTKRL